MKDLGDSYVSTQDISHPQCLLVAGALLILSLSLAYTILVSSSRSTTLCVSHSSVSNDEMHNATSTPLEIRRRGFTMEGVRQPVIAEDDKFPGGVKYLCIVII